MLDLSILPPWQIGLVYFILGASVGSFLNVVSWRLPQMMQAGWRQQCREFLGQNDSSDGAGDEAKIPNLIRPGSFCPHCKTPIKPWYNIPILGYLLLRGRCASCKASISARYPVIELITGLLTLHAGLYFATGFDFDSLLKLVMIFILLWSLILLTSIDVQQQLLPDSITLPLLWLGLIFNLNNGFVTLQAAVLGAIAGYLILWSIYQIHHLITGKEGMGYGDFKLLAALGAWFGWQLLPLIILMAAGTGTLVALFLMLFKHLTRDIPIAFGPYLAMAGWICLFWGQTLFDHYLQVTRL